ncbi:hypothetical protein [Paenibacillus xylanexedens]|uniref:hypothetical protein n=1 Tax=Paenibacillus xylanexedens TaxID=528191 RepID=UPI000F5477ED|nr:hypothetical protein [Paenibacillus xylanexedens]RPK31775.1 hypothetical protein EDO6_02402 [Paenibacillus xylanexedens]
MKIYEEILNSDESLVEALNIAAETEGVMKWVKLEGLNKYRELERIGCIELIQIGTGGATVYLTSEGRDYLEQYT